MSSEMRSLFCKVLTLSKIQKHGPISGAELVTFVEAHCSDRDASLDDFTRWAQNSLGGLLVVLEKSGYITCEWDVTQIEITIRGVEFLRECAVMVEDDPEAYGQLHYYKKETP